ncbi:MAG: CDP-alcohol phosphatidyltransferase family protein [Planctomycetales bacterium]|nr:CDP-alcohol phosphatidyltransferase family protein [Planctomycetales bacterium]
MNRERADQGPRLTATNAITGLRLVGSPALIVCALQDWPWGVALVVTLLVFTEWLDGFLARRLHQQSEFGARLDTIADASFYLSLLVALSVLFPSPIAIELPWIIAAIGSYSLSWLVAWVRFGRLPSYHTWLAKAAWFVVGLGAVGLVAGWDARPFRVAMLTVVVANLEATLITCILRQSQADVPSLWHAHRARVSR